MNCPHCASRDTKSTHFCTICDVPHMDCLCNACGRRFVHPVKFDPKTDEALGPALPREAESDL